MILFHRHLLYQRQNILLGDVFAKKYVGRLDLRRGEFSYEFQKIKLRRTLSLVYREFSILPSFVSLVLTNVSSCSNILNIRMAKYLIICQQKFKSSLDLFVCSKKFFPKMKGVPRWIHLLVCGCMFLSIL